jgi:hypothetical protein
MEGANAAQVNNDALTTAARPTSFAQKMGHAYVHLTSHDVAINAVRLAASAQNLDVFSAHLTGSAVVNAALKAFSASRVDASGIMKVVLVDVHRASSATMDNALEYHLTHARMAVHKAHIALRLDVSQITLVRHLVRSDVHPTSHVLKVVAINQIRHLVRSDVHPTSHVLKAVAINQTRNLVRLDVHPTSHVSKAVAITLSLHHLHRRPGVALAIVLVAAHPGLSVPRVSAFKARFVTLSGRSLTSQSSPKKRTPTCIFFFA